MQVFFAQKLNIALAHLVEVGAHITDVKYVEIKDLSVGFAELKEPIESRDYLTLQSGPGEPYVLTIIAEHTISSDIMKELVTLLAKASASVKSLKKLAENVLELVYVGSQFDTRPLEQKFMTDIAVQPFSVHRKAKRLAIFDMDSTLIQQEVIDELAKEVGVMDEVKAITHRAMNGELDFKASLKERVALLKGAPVDILERVRQRLIFTEGARELCRALKRLGFKLAVVSGGFLPLAKFVKSELGLDFAFANQLSVDEYGKLAGKTTGHIVDAERKRDLLLTLSQLENVPREQIIAVGDGANDLLMLKEASVGVAYRAKPKVQEQANVRLNNKSLLNVLYLLGYTDSEIKELSVLL